MVLTAGVGASTKKALLLKEVLLKVMEIVEDSGAQLALPTEIHYVSATEPIDDNQVTT